MSKFCQNKGISLIISLICTYCIQFVIFEDAYISLMRNMLSLVFIVAFYFVIQKGTSICTKHMMLFTLPLSFLMSFGMVIGHRLYYFGFVENYFLILIPILIISFLLFCFLNIIFDFLDRFSCKNKANKVIDYIFDSKYSFLIIVILLFVMWMPFYFGVFPSVIDPDVAAELEQYRTMTFNSGYPVIHTLFFGFTLLNIEKLTGSFTFARAFISIFQGCVVACSISHALKKMSLFKVPNKYKLYALIFFGICPILPISIASTTKDTLFSALFFLLLINTLCLYVEYDSIFKDKKRIVLMVIEAIICVLLRKNAIYACIVFVLCLLLKRQKKKIIIFFCTICALSMVIDTSINTVFHAEKGAVQEMLSVPIQQLARVYNVNKDSMSDREIETLLEIFPEEGLNSYSPYISDPVKATMNQDMFKSNPGKYFNLWFKVGIRNPSIYFDSFFSNNLFLYYPDAIFAGTESVSGKDSLHTTNSWNLIVNEYDWAPILPISKIMYKVDLAFSRGTIFRNIPLVSLIYTIAFMMWSLIIFLLYILYSKKSKPLTMPIFLGLLYILTLCLGPTMYIRYFMYLWLFVPIEVIIVLSSNHLDERSIME